MLKKVVVFLVVMIMVMSGQTAHAGKDVRLTVGNSKVVSVRSMQRVAIGNPEVADIKEINEKELLITGKQNGTTSLIVWKKSGRKDISTVVVSSSKVAKTMIQVDVQVMEITKTEDMDLGINWEKMLGSAGQLKLTESTFPMNAIGTLERGGLDLLLKLLVEKGNAKILAKPKLVTLSGKQAKFSSGGEIPVATINTNNQASVSWKSYGVKLDVLPKVTHSNEVSVDLRAEVSDVDFTRLVQDNPAIKTRWASTSIHVKPGSTVVIGGLIQEKNQVVHQGIPILSDIPVLGYLFKSSRVVREDSELVIFVTPHIIGG